MKPNDKIKQKGEIIPSTPSQLEYELVRDFIKFTDKHGGVRVTDFVRHAIQKTRLDEQNKNADTIIRKFKLKDIAKDARHQAISEVREWLHKLTKKLEETDNIDAYSIGELLEEFDKKFGGEG